MANTKPKKISGITPIGIASWVHNTRPDTKFGTPGNFSADLILTPEEAQPLIDFLQPVLDAYVAEVRKDDPRTEEWQLKSLFSKEYDKEAKAYTGRYIFHFKLPAQFTLKDESIVKNEVKHRDALNQVIDAPRIGNGSKIRIAYEVRPYAKAALGIGLSLRLKGIQVIDLVEFGGDMGFDAVEGGYVGAPPAPVSAPADADNSEWGNDEI